MKKTLILLMSLIVICLLLSSCKNDNEIIAYKVLLSENWMLQSSSVVGSDGSLLSTDQVSINEWYPATVPSTVMGVLTANGLYEDLLVGMNYKDADRKPFDVSWWYRTIFKLPLSKEGKRVKIEFDGLSYRANIWLNGQLIASKDDVYGPFCRFSFDITDYLKEENILAVEIFRAQAGEPNIGFVDWNPRPLDENMGIFREVRLIVSGEVEMTNTWVQSKVNTESLNEAWLSIETKLVNTSDKKVKGYLKGKIEDEIFSIPVSLEAKEEKKVKITSDDVKKLHVKNPRLWWCNNMGNPELYELDLQFITNNQVSAQEKVTFGIRQIETYTTPKGHKGFILNGKKVLMKSAGWTDDIFLRDTPETNEIQVQYVKDMNLNMIRFENVWGTSQNIYDLCDRYGLMAFVGWSCQWEWEGYFGTPDDEFGSVKSEADMKLLTRFLHDQVIWLRNHPSVIAWLGGSDKLPRPELEKMYMDIYSQIEDRPYMGAAKGLTSSVSGSTGMKMNGPYEYVGSNYWFVDSVYGGGFGFNTETGPGPQLPAFESIERMIPEDKLWPINNYWDFHCTTATVALNSLDVLNKAINGKFGETNNLTDYLNRAYLLNYESTKSMFEAFRINKTEGTGIVQWMLNSAWPSLYWQLYDFYMIPTAAYYGVKKGNEALQLIYNYKDDGIYVVNETCSDIDEYVAVIRVFSIDSKELYKKEVKFSIGTNQAQKIAEIDSYSNKNSFLVLNVFDKSDKNIADNFYTLSSKKDSYQWDKTDWVGTPISEYADFKDLAKLPKSTLKTKLSTDVENDVNIINVELENTSSTIALLTQLAMKDDNGEIVYPVFWSDNYVSLLPGETKEIKCCYNRNELKKQPIYLQISGWNSDKQQVNLN